MAYRFRPSLWPSAVTLLLLLVLSSLGFWQLDRAQQKRELLDRYEAQDAGAPIRVDDRLRSSADLEFRAAQANGRYDGAHQFLLDNRTHHGVAGYQVLTPLRLAGGKQAILVNRGWVPQGATRQDLPDLPVPAGPVQVQGLLRAPPQKVFVLGEGEDRELGWPKLLQRVRLDLQSEQLGYALSPMMLLLDAGEEYGFTREWQPIHFGPERNVGYAVQWFALATALMLIYLVVNTKRDVRDDQN